MQTCTQEIPIILQVVPVAWVGRVAGMSPQLQGLPAIRVQVFAVPVTHQQEGISLLKLAEVCGQVSCER